MKDCCDNNATFMAYWKRSEEGNKLTNLLKRVWRKFDPPPQQKNWYFNVYVEDIINYLNEKGITKREISDKLGVHPNTLSNLKKNSRNIPVLTWKNFYSLSLSLKTYSKNYLLKNC
jgi:hypothetical protein